MPGSVPYGAHSPSPAQPQPPPRSSSPSSASRDRFVLYHHLPHPLQSSPPAPSSSSSSAAYPPAMQSPPPPSQQQQQQQQQPPQPQPPQPSSSSSSSSSSLARPNGSSPPSRFQRATLPPLTVSATPQRHRHSHTYVRQPYGVDSPGAAYEHEHGHGRDQRQQQQQQQQYGLAAELGAPLPPPLQQPLQQSQQQARSPGELVYPAQREMDVPAPAVKQRTTSHSAPQQKPARAADPMSFASILSAPADDLPRRSSAAAPPSAHNDHGASPLPPPPPPLPSKPDHPDLALLPSSSSQVPTLGVFHAANGTATPSKANAPARPHVLSPAENDQVNKEMERIDAVNASDVESSGWEREFARYQEKRKKRARQTEAFESNKRKKRRGVYLAQLTAVLEKQVLCGTDRFNRIHEAEVQSEVHQKDILDEKERKKDMQRKRRRENTVRLETQKMEEAERKANAEEDVTEKDRLLREVERSLRKIKTTQRALERGNEPEEEISEVAPMAPNLEGGTTSSFHLKAQQSAPPSPPPPPPPPAKKKTGKGTGTARPKKTKEQKQAEKDAAEAAYAAIERDELPLAPKEEAKAGSEEAATPTPVSSFDSKGYNQIYEQIWREIARKDVPKVYRIKCMSLNNRQDNLRKTAQLASKQARKWQERTNKSTKDTQTRAKRSMREMMSFWKRNERNERDLRRMAERQELEQAKKAEADREANRQRRKLNFLISQTELYSHFIGHKIKTDEAEQLGEAAAEAAAATAGGPIPPKKPVADVEASDGQPTDRVRDFGQLDFDAIDDATLRQAAMANAQNAVQEAQDRARAFNGAAAAAAEQQKTADFDDEGEMNFQNPTSLGDVQVPQPKMLSIQLKEYQLKGLNWLVNLYEQGINGILADEMGLGKTVQSISVMAYLAEVHNIWGPFLVIAPASTLHNWQQEISRFVPNIKVLPYWGSAKDRKVLRKFWDRKHITYTKDSEFHVLVTSYQLVVLDAQYFQKVKWQYMILDEAQAIKSSQSSRWKNLLGFHCRNRLLLTGTPIQNNMQELWALLHFIMPTLFDSHDEFSEWFSKDIESHAQSNTKLNEDQLRRLHMILKPFMLRRIKKHVQQELGDKIEKDVFCDLTYRQRAYYTSLRNRVSILDLIEKAAVGDDSDSTTLMNLVMQFRKVCNHPDLFERAETTSPLSLAHFAETASFVREGQNVDVRYSTRNVIDFPLPRMLCGADGRLDMPGHANAKAGFDQRYLSHLMSIWAPENIANTLSKREEDNDDTFAWLRFTDVSASDAYETSHQGVFERAVKRRGWEENVLGRFKVVYDEDEEPEPVPVHSMFRITDQNDRRPVAEVATEGRMQTLLNVSRAAFSGSGLEHVEPCTAPGASAPPIMTCCSGKAAEIENANTFFNIYVRHALFDRPSEAIELEMVDKKVDPIPYSVPPMLPTPNSAKGGYTSIKVPSMGRFVTDSGKLAKLDELLRELKNGGHRVLLYFQMTRMIDLVEEYLTYRNYKYCRLDGSTKLEDRRDTVLDFQQRPEIFVFLLSTRAGGLGINLTAADTVIFYDSDWNPTIDSQAMDRAHRLGQTKQVTVYRLITRGTIEEQIRKRALQKEEVQRVVISGGAVGGVDFNTRSRENRTKDIALWLADDQEAELIEQREKEAIAEKGAEAQKKGKKAAPKRKKDLSMDELYHEGEGHFDDQNKPLGTATPAENEPPPVVPPAAPPSGTGKRSRGGGGRSKKAKTTKERLQLIDGQ